MKKFFLSLILIIGFLFSFTANTSAATSSSIAGRANTDGYNLNVRASTSVSSAIIGKISDNSYFTILRSSGDWYYVEFKENQYGYVHKDYVSKVSDNVKRVDTNGSNLNARRGPSTSYLAFDKISDNDYVIVLSNSNGWSKILFEGNKIGYVSSTYLSSTNYTYPKINLNVVSYKQYDSRWANKTIGTSGKTFKQIGCVTTGMAMIESYRRGTTITPAYMESISNYTPDGSFYWPSRYEFYSGTNYLNKIYTLLKSGKPVLFGAKSTNGGQHWVVIYGYEGGNTLSASNFLIHDPGSSTRTNLKQFLNSYPNFYKLTYYTY